MSIFIKTKRLTLREFNVNDAAKLESICNQEHILEWMPDFRMTEKQLEGWIKRTQQVYKTVNIKERCLVLGVEKECELIGIVGIGPKAEINNKIEIAYFISQKFCNMGYITEAVKAMIWWVFEVAKIDYLVAIVQPGNKPSQRVVEKVGFIKGDTIMVEHDGEDKPFYFYKFYHIDYIPNPDWNFSCNVEEMSGFFDARAGGYDSHMLKSVGDIECYRRVAEPIPANSSETNILDLGCGTGIELEYLFDRVPEAKVTCIDMSEKMLELLKSKYSLKAQHIQTICGSYIDWEYPQEFFDYVVSSFTLHHFMEDVKVGIYKNILLALKSGGLYIESDFIVDRMMMEQYLKRYHRITKGLTDKQYSGYYHIDIPFTIELQKELLLRAGFSHVSVFYEDIKPKGSHAVLVAQK